MTQAAAQSQTKPANDAMPSEPTDEQATAKGAANADSKLGDGLYDQEFLDLIKETEEELVDIDESRAELNAKKAHLMARLVDKGLNKDAVKAAIKYFRTPEEKRENFDLSYQICRKALHCPVQDDLFVAAAQRQIDQHQAGKQH